MPTTTSTLTTATSRERPAGSDHPAQTEPREADTMPLTAALLTVAAKGLSFATPGHRCGRSCQPDR